MNEEPRAFTSPPREKSLRLDPTIAERIASAVLTRKPVPENVAERREQNRRARLSKGDPLG